MRSELAIAALACVFGLAACGGGGSELSTDSSQSAQEPSAAFAGKGENGVLATAGKESNAAERNAASEVVERSMRARAARNWEAQCATLARSFIEQLEGASSGGFFKQGCAEVLETVARQATPAALENTMVEPLAAFRVNGSRAFAFYHGAQGRDYVVPMEQEGGEWKILSLVPQETP